MRKCPNWYRSPLQASTCQSASLFKMAPVLKDEDPFPVLPWPKGRYTLSFKTSCQESSNKHSNLEIRIINAVLLVTYLAFIICIYKNYCPRTWKLFQWSTAHFRNPREHMSSKKLAAVNLLSSVRDVLVWKLSFVISTLFWSNMFPESGLPEQNICSFFQYRKLELIRI